MQTQKLYDEYLITTIIPAIEPIEIESPVVDQRAHGA